MQIITIFSNSTGYCLSIGKQTLFEGISQTELLAIIPELIKAGFACEGVGSGITLLAA